MSTWPGGLRSRVREVAPTINEFWTNESFHNYADYAMGERFREGLAHLRCLGETQCCAIMCAETVWWRCHRRLIAELLAARGHDVLHLLRPGVRERHRLYDESEIRDGRLYLCGALVA